MAFNIKNDFKLNVQNVQLVHNINHQNDLLTEQYELNGIYFSIFLIFFDLF